MSDSRGYGVVKIYYDKNKYVIMRVFNVTDGNPNILFGSVIYMSWHKIRESFLVTLDSYAKCEKLTKEEYMLEML